MTAFEFLLAVLAGAAAIGVGIGLAIVLFVLQERYYAKKARP